MSEQDHLDLLKEVVAEMRTLRERITSLEAENSALQKAMLDPETLMRKAGWQKVTTPHADETFDPLNRSVPSESQFDSPFTGSGDVFVKSRFDQIAEWEAAEKEVRS